MRRFALLLALLLALLPARAEGIPEDLLEPELLEAAPDFTGWSDGEPRIAYGTPDALGRPTAAEALLGPELLSSAERGDMSALHPVGLHNARYDFIRDGWVYNRCHLVGHQFSGVSGLENLIAGTHALNHSYMLPWENRVAAYIRATGGHVFYRVTPLYEGDELVCRRVLLEAQSADGGAGLRFAVLCPNAQPGVAIDYASGYTTLADDWQTGGTAAGPRDYLINIKTGKFHRPECRDARRVSRRNRLERTADRVALIAEGLIPCGKCCP